MREAEFQYFNRPNQSELDGSDVAPIRTWADYVAGNSFRLFHAASQMTKPLSKQRFASFSRGILAPASHLLNAGARSCRSRRAASLRAGIADEGPVLGKEP